MNILLNNRSRSSSCRSIRPRSFPLYVYRGIPFRNFKILRRSATADLLSLFFALDIWDPPVNGQNPLFFLPSSVFSVSLLSLCSWRHARSDRAARRPGGAHGRREGRPVVGALNWAGGRGARLRRQGRAAGSSNGRREGRPVAGALNYAGGRGARLRRQGRAAGSRNGVQQAAVWGGEPVDNGVQMSSRRPAGQQRRMWRVVVVARPAVRSEGGRHGRRRKANSTCEIADGRRCARRTDGCRGWPAVARWLAGRIGRPRNPMVHRPCGRRGREGKGEGCLGEMGWKRGD